MCQYIVLLKVLYFFFNPLHISKDMRLQNIDACEDILR